MSHNPILRHLNLGRFERFTVEKGTVAVLFKNQRIERLAEPGERIGNIQADIVDLSPQVLVWRAELPSSHQDDFFSCTFTLRYAVSNPTRMVKDSVTDTETLLTRVLEQKFRVRTRKVALNHHTELEREMAELLDALALQDACGLEFLESPDVVFNFSEQTKARIKELDRQEKAIRLPQSAVHVDDLPSSEPAYRFRVQVNVRYQVTNLADVPYDTLAEAEQQLWPRLQRALRKAGRQYPVVEIAKAEAAMQDSLDDLLDGKKVQGFGLALLAVDVAADLEEAARTRYVELATIEHAAAMEKAKLAGLKENTSFFTDLIRQGSWAVLAVAVSKGEVTMDELYQRMSLAEQQKLAMQIDLLKSLRQDNSRDEAQDWRVSQDLLDAVAGHVLRPTVPGLSATQSSGQLTDGKATGDSQP